MMRGGFGGRSMTAPLRRALLRAPEPTDLAAWADFGWLEQPDPAAAAREHEAFADLLREAGVDVHTCFAEEVRERLVLPRGGRGIGLLQPSEVRPRGEVGRLGRAEQGTPERRRHRPPAEPTSHHHVSPELTISDEG